MLVGRSTAHGCDAFSKAHDLRLSLSDLGAQRICHEAGELIEVFCCEDLLVEKYMDRHRVRIILIYVSVLLYHIDTFTCSSLYVYIYSHIYSLKS